LNLAAPGSGSKVEDLSLLVRNAWVEAPLIDGSLILRAGKLYRRFGLSNEILDATPTFIGIEAPELFDEDHLLLTRTTNLMLHGSLGFDSGVVNYALTTGAARELKAARLLNASADVNANVGACKHEDMRAASWQTRRVEAPRAVAARGKTWRASTVV
jgi:hypothetical protein